MARLSQYQRKQRALNAATNRLRTAILRTRQATLYLAAAQSNGHRPSNSYTSLNPAEKLLKGVLAYTLTEQANTVQS